MENNVPENAKENKLSSPSAPKAQSPSEATAFAKLISTLPANVKIASVTANVHKIDKPSLIDNEEYESKISQLIEKLQDKQHKCRKCNRVYPHLSTMRRHVECHLTGYTFPCNKCEYSTSSRASYRKHLSGSHK